MRNIDFNKYQSALIIGNGFDLSLGLSTSYMDFVNSDEFQILLNMQNQLATVHNRGFLAGTQVPYRGQEANSQSGGSQVYS